MTVSGRRRQARCACDRWWSSTSPAPAPSSFAPARRVRSPPGGPRPGSRSPRSSRSRPARWWPPCSPVGIVAVQRRREPDRRSRPRRLAALRARQRGRGGRRRPRCSSAPPASRPRLESLDDFLRLVNAPQRSARAGARHRRCARPSRPSDGGGLHRRPGARARLARRVHPGDRAGRDSRCAAARRRRRAELLVQTAALFAVTLLVFAPRPAARRSPSRRCRSWSGRRCASTSGWSPGSCSAPACSCTMLTAEGHGPFAAIGRGRREHRRRCAARWSSSGCSAPR